MIRMRGSDIVLVRGGGMFSAGIRALTRSPKESPTRVTHAALMVSPTHLVEATIGKPVSVSRYEHGEVWRPLNVSKHDRGHIVSRALSHVGKPYGYGKVALAALDGLLGGAYLFRRLAIMEGFPICSWLVADAYSSRGRMFGVDVRAATPDDIDDFVRSSHHYIRIR